MTTAVVSMTCLLVVGVLGAGELEVDLDRLVTAYHELGQFNGSVLVAANGEVVLAGGYGLANMEWGIPNRPDTKFRLGSITKQFTAALILQLVEEGRLSLDATLSEILTDYRADTGARVTLHHLLSHTSGIPSYTGAPEFRSLKREPFGVKEFVSNHCSGDLEFEPGSAFRYSNSGYFLLGAVIEEVTGKPYETVLAERILEPLGMADTGYDHHGTILEHRAAGYERSGGGYRNADYLDMSIPYAAGALYSTVEDLHRWDRALEGDTVLPPAARAKMFTPVLEGYAYGWGVAERPVGPDGSSRVVISHGGGIDGFNTLIARVPEDGHLVVLLNNTGGAPLGALQSGVLDLLYGRTPPPPKRPVAEVLLPFVEQEGVAAALAELRRLEAEEPEGYLFGEGQLNNLGYQLLGSGRVEAAIAVFELNVERYPEAFNPHDSLGEAYMTAGKRQDAIRSFARSLELNPDNRNAIQQLARLAGLAPAE